MCFSASASFVAGGTLVAIGAVAFWLERYSRRACLLALLPIIFGIHQMIEGVVWLGLNGVVPEQVLQLATYAFTVIAMSLWPIYIPLSILVYEYPQRRLPLALLISIGVFVSLYLGWGYSIYSNVQAHSQCCNSIAYEYYLPHLHGIIDVLYILAVIPAFFLSTNNRIRYVLGPTFTGSLLVALLITSGVDYPSIWCFLAAVISLVVIYSLRGQQR